MYNANGIMQGWQCPVCGRVLSPFNAECPCYREKPSAATTVKIGDSHPQHCDGICCDHNWVFDGPVTEGTRYYCSKCRSTKTEPFGGII